MNQNPIGNKIKQLRADKGLTQKALSVKIGLSKDYVTKIELGIKIPPFTTYLKIAEALEVDVQEITNTDPFFKEIHKTIDKIGIERAISILSKYLD